MFKRQNNDRQQTTDRILHLDSLRGLAILLVFLYHAYARWGWYLPFSNNTKDIFLFEYGHLGVQLFFMISGFVIFMSLDKSQYFKQFIYKRWLRVFPGMLAASVFLYATDFFFHESPRETPTLVDLLPGLLFTEPQIISYFLGVEVKELEGVFWSLYAEMRFYLVSGLIYFFVGREFLLKTIFMGFVLGLITLEANIPFIFKLDLINYAYFFIGAYIYERNYRTVTQGDTLCFIATLCCLLFSIKFDIGRLVAVAGILFIFIASFHLRWIQAILMNKFFLFFGFISYPLFLLHEQMMISISLKIMKLEITYDVLSPLISLCFISILAYILAKIEPVLRSIINFKKN